MKKKTMFGLAAGIFLGTAAAIAVKTAVGKISEEMKNGLVTEEFDSPLGDNWVKVSMGSSEAAKGLACIKVQAEADRNEDSCKLVLFAKKDADISYEWEDDEHFKLFVGSGKTKQCCDVEFSVEKITARYYMIKA